MNQSSTDIVTSHTPSERLLTEPKVIWTRIEKMFGMRTQRAQIRYACGHVEEHFYPLPKGTRPMSLAGVLRTSEAISTSTCPIAWRVCFTCARPDSAA